MYGSNPVGPPDGPAVTTTAGPQATGPGGGAATIGGPIGTGETMRSPRYTEVWPQSATLIGSGVLTTVSPQAAALMGSAGSAAGAGLS